MLFFLFFYNFFYNFIIICCFWQKERKGISKKKTTGDGGETEIKKGLTHVRFLKRLRNQRATKLPLVGVTNLPVYFFPLRLSASSLSFVPLLSFLFNYSLLFFFLIWVIFSVF